MRIDREAFLLAVSALAGCERAEPTPTRAPPPAPRPAAAIAREVPREPVAPPAPSPMPAPTHLADRPPAPPRAKGPRRPMSKAKRWFIGLAMGDRDELKAACEQASQNPCGNLLSGPGPRAAVSQEEDPFDKYLAGMSEEQRGLAVSYCREMKNLPAPHCETPLVVAFDNQAVEFEEGAEQFAFVPGEPMATDWPTAATPWIALDRDGDGAITSGAELFGSSTVLADGARARNGFEALAALDANGDGTLDARDPAFARLVLWSDSDGDRRTTPGELRPLASVVTAIPLAHAIDARCNARGDCEGERGELRWRDTRGAEHAGAVIDIYVRRR